MTRQLLCLSVALLFAAPAYADPAERLQRVFAQTVASRTQTMTFFQGLAGLEDLDLRGEALSRVLQDSGMDKAQGMLGAFVSGMQRIVKDGSTVTIYRAGSVDLETPNGAVRIPKKARFRVHSQGAHKVKLDKMDGAKAGKSVSSLHPLRWLELSVDGEAITTAKLNAGYGFGFNKTVTIVLKRPAPAEAHADEAGAGGLAANVPE